MTFQFENLSELLAMNGHGAFVWASYFITIVALLVIVVIPVIQQRQLFKQLQRQQRIAASQANRSRAQ